MLRLIILLSTLLSGVAFAQNTTPDTAIAVIHKTLICEDTSSGNANSLMEWTEEGALQCQNSNQDLIKHLVTKEYEPLVRRGLHYAYKKTKEEKGLNEIYIKSLIVHLKPTMKTLEMDIVFYLPIEGEEYEFSLGPMAIH